MKRGNLMDTIEALKSIQILDGLEEARGLALGGVDVIDRLWARQFAFREATIDLVESLNTFCPTVRPLICQNVTSNYNCTFDDIPFADEVKAVFEVTRVDWFLKLSGIHKDLLVMADDFQDAKEAAENFGWAFWMAASYALALAALTLIIMWGVIRAWSNNTTHDGKAGDCILRCLRNWFVVPLYALLVFLSWLFSMIFLVLSTSTADFCVNSPDPRVLAVLAKNRYKFHSLVYQYVTWIVGGCPEGGVPSQIQDAVGVTLRLLQAVSNLSRAIDDEENASDEFWDETCGGRPDYLIDFASTAERIVCLTANSLRDVEVFFSCGNWHPVYEETIYRSVCWESTKGFKWIATTQVIIVGFSSK